MGCERDVCVKALLPLQREASRAVRAARVPHYRLILLCSQNVYLWHFLDLHSPAIKGFITFRLHLYFSSYERQEVEK